ncbi:sulfatase-like hydrolase/transferase [Methylobacterium frigidaeris]|uniref:N-acetylgalactosamine-6-O-sulfatase n=1 Tax=Methylobacterium frigidaeris TaxID=2038277 RepID=A0AA37M523_9HYPH|nr:sulfatase-like hydrolase/transferase [Methylobacterium frigidaeris]GJD62141.1 N-acetylgalactosamine-6-O-sulfatase [Methylobacterium frigidaeris]
MMQDSEFKRSEPGLDRGRRTFVGLAGSAAIGLWGLCRFGEVARAADASNGPVDPLLATVERTSDHREPAIRRPAQDEEMRRKLARLQQRTGRKPNIVIVLMDDVGWGDFGVYGGGAAVGALTPTIDRLAQDGLRLTSAYSQPSCTPTRASLLTGRLPMRSGLLRPFLPGENEKTEGLGGEITLAALLGQAGYATQAIGKWHLGSSTGAQPQNVGFDNYYGILTSSDDYTAWREPWRNPEIATDPARTEWASKGEIMAIVEGRSGSPGKPVYPIDLHTVRFVDEKLTERAVGFVESRKPEDPPFFLYLATRGAHFDNYAHPDFSGRSPARYPYKDVIQEIDARVGQVVEALRRTGQLDNTLVVVTSDNGPMAETFPDTGHTPFRSAKGTAYEGGVRTPLIAHWPGMIAPGRVSDGLFDLMDLFVTCLTLAGAGERVPSDRYIDGIDQAGFLLADAGQSARRVQHYWRNQSFMGVRVGEYKLMVRHQEVTSPDTFPYESPFQSSVAPAGSGERIYNLYVDPREQHAMLPLKQIHYPTLAAAAAQHLATFEKYPPKIPMR